MSRQLNARTIALIAEVKIIEAMRDGEFDNLPGFGRPFEFDELEYDPNWWVKQKLKREDLACKINADRTR